MKKITATTSNQKGFTLVELLVAISIVAILAIIGITVFSGAQKTSRDAKRKADIAAIANAYETHINTSVNQYCTGAAGNYCPLSTTWFASNTIPTDPSTASNYAGLLGATAATYSICATLEAGGTYCRANQQ